MTRLLCLVGRDPLRLLGGVREGRPPDSPVSVLPCLHLKWWVGPSDSIRSHNLVSPSSSTLEVPSEGVPGRRGRTLLILCSFPGEVYVPRKSDRERYTLECLGGPWGRGPNISPFFIVTPSWEQAPVPYLPVSSRHLDLGRLGSRALGMTTKDSDPPHSPSFPEVLFVHERTPTTPTSFTTARRLLFFTP